MIALHTPRDGRLAPASHPRLLVAWIALAYAAVYLLWWVLGDASATARALGARAAYIPLSLAAAILLVRAARHSANHGVRVALGFLAATELAVTAGGVLTVTSFLAAGSVSFRAEADALYLIAYPLNIAALLAIRGGERSDRWKLLCDAGMVLSGVGVALWYFVLRSAVPPGAELSTMVRAIFYPLADLLLIVGLATILLRRAADRHRSAVQWLAVATALLVVADLSVNLLLASSGQASAGWVEALFFAYSIAQVTAAERFSHGPRDEPAPGPRRLVVMDRLRTALPLLAAGGAYLLLLVVALRNWTAPLSELAIGAVAVSLFLGARQLLTFRRNAAILAEQAVRASEARFRSLVQHSSDLVFQLDATGTITFASSSAGRVIGYEPDALVGVSLSALATEDDATRVASFLEMARHLPGVSPTSEWRLRRGDGEVVQVEVVASNLLADPTVEGIVINARDIGERKALLEQLAHQAFHDPLTGLANRALFYDRVSHALALARRQGRTVMVLFLDLDDFKQVNDTLGHAEGDRLLTMIAARLRACARVTDTVARLGGDEFAVLVEDDRPDEGGLRLVARIREQMAYPFTLADTEVRISASIGSATGHEGNADELLRNADLAMYAAKRAEKGTHRAWDRQMLGR